MSKEYLKLTVPNDLSYLNIINNTVTEVSKKYGFSGKTTGNVAMLAARGGPDGRPGGVSPGSSRATGRRKY